MALKLNYWQKIEIISVECAHQTYTDAIMVILKSFSPEIGQAIDLEPLIWAENSYVAFLAVDSLCTLFSLRVEESKKNHGFVPPINMFFHVVWSYMTLEWP